jgi:[ribosomal protein S5]-alanine N-acetyltransferase
VTDFALSMFEAPLVVPELRSGPVLLRPFRPSDLDLIRHATSDPYIPTITSVPAVYSDDAARAFIARQHSRSDGGHGYPFVIAYPAEPGSGLGALGLWLREIEEGRASVGYWMAPSARGKRLAGWALRGIASFAFDVLAIPRLHLFVEPWNIASQRTAEFAGFTQEALLRGWERIDEAQHDVYCYSLLRQDWISPGATEGPHVAS